MKIYMVKGIYCGDFYSLKIFDSNEKAIKYKKEIESMEDFKEHWDKIVIYEREVE